MRALCKEHLLRMEKEIEHLIFQADISKLWADIYWNQSAWKRLYLKEMLIISPVQVANVILH